MIIQLPFSLLFGTAAALDSVLGDGFRKQSTSFEKASDVIAIHLLYERFCAPPNSSWQPFIKSLPHSFSSLLMWSQSEVDSLGNSHLSLVMAKKFRNLLRRYESLSTTLPQVVPGDQSTLSWFTFDNFKWAHACIASRSVYYDENKMPKRSSTLSFCKGAYHSRHSIAMLSKTEASLCCRYLRSCSVLGFAEPLGCCRVLVLRESYGWIVSASSKQ